MDIATQDSDDVRWPAIDAAFAFVLPSYQMMMSRFEAADTRLTSLLTLVATFTLGAPVFAKNVQSSLSFGSLWFILAMSCSMLAVACGVWGRMYGSLVLVNPSVLYRESLHELPWEFKKNALLYAGKHFERNANAIETKALLSDGVIVFFVLEIASLILWFIR